MAFTIGQLAASAEVGVETIRFYERKGLIAQPKRPADGYRNYDQQMAGRIRFIQTAQELGFTLREIKQLLSLRVDPRTSCADVRGKAEEKISDIDEKLRTLRRMRTALVEITKTCVGTGPTSDCPILDYMETPRKKEVSRGGIQER